MQVTPCSPWAGCWDTLPGEGFEEVVHYGLACLGPWLAMNQPGQ